MRTKRITQNTLMRDVFTCPEELRDYLCQCGKIAAADRETIAQDPGCAADIYAKFAENGWRSTQTDKHLLSIRELQYVVPGLIAGYRRHVAEVADAVAESESMDVAAPVQEQDEVSICDDNGHSVRAILSGMIWTPESDIKQILTEDDIATAARAYLATLIGMHTPPEDTIPPNPTAEERIWCRYGLLASTTLRNQDHYFADYAEE